MNAAAASSPCTFFTVTVDTEEEWNWNEGWPTANYSLENIQILPRFQDLCSHHGVATTYFVNHAVLADAPSRDIVLGLARREGVELGMHIHPWNTPPLDASKLVTARETFIQNLPRDAALAKLATVLDAFARCGVQPTSFRGGRYSSGEVVHQFLRSHGFIADASVVPFSSWRDDGAPDYRRRGLEPRRLAPPSAADRALWEIPLTLAFTRRPFALWSAVYGAIERTWLRRLRLIGLCEAARVVRKAWLNFEDPLGRDMDRLLAVLRRMGLPCINFTVHSSSLMAGKNPYTPTRSDQERLFERMDQIFSLIRGWPELRPATVTEVAAELERKHHARTGD